MDKRLLPAAAALAANLLFWASVLGFGALREGYDHREAAVSYLGLVGSPNALAFNLLGYVLPGLLLAWSGWRVGRAASGWLTASLLALVGASVALSGVFPADLGDRDGWLTRTHIAVGMLGLPGAAAWLVLAGRAWRRHRLLAVWGLAGAALFVLAFIVTGAVEQSDRELGGLAQRMRFFVAFGWYPVAAAILLREPRA